MEIVLLQSTGNGRADDILRGAIGVLEAVFPDRIRGYYLVGSYADGSYVATSDLDVVPIFKGRLGDDDRARCLEIVHALDLISPIHLGFGLRDEEQSFADGGVGIKIGSVLVYGEDVRDRIPLWSLDRYRDFCVQTCLDIAVALRGSPDRLSYPLAYPDPHGPFYGYVQEMQTQNGVEPGTAALFGNVMFAASTIVTLRTGRYNASKSRSWKLYQECIGDEWGGFLEELYGTCKVHWEY
ncbi:MAG TPA: nucleotidyltransferase domain-containing protein, partial [Ardenticatenaceae bacterium]|nr:nucleotidyltransferase domain-containing protein [Ardenticatenaceae bacterium]